MIKLEKKHWFGIILGVLILVAVFIFLRDNKIFYFVVVFAVIIAAAPFFAGFLIEQGTQKDKEERFLGFTRDLVESVKSGTPVSKSIINLKNRHYGPLSQHVEKLANQLAMGITLTQALETFAKETKSNVIKRAVGLISEAERAGGRIDTILESVANSVNQVEEIKKERKSSVYNLIVQGYIIFIVFIIIMLVLEYSILPLTGGLTETGGGLGSGGLNGLNLGSTGVSKEDFSMPMFIMLLTQSLFAGLVIGKIAEGEIKDGIKHSVILLALTLLIVTGAKAFLG
jgi:flagellar protein FlaJ